MTKENVWGQISGIAVEGLDFMVMKIDCLP